MNFSVRYLIPAFVVAANGAATLGAHAAYQLGMQEPASEMAAIQQDLNVFMMVIITIIGAGVFGAMFYSILKHRKDKGYQAANFHENTLVEVIWTAVPMIIIIFMAIPATSAILKYKNTDAPDITIKATGYQWKWSYDYLEHGIFFYSQLTTPPEEIGGKYYSGYVGDEAQEVAANPQSENYLLEVDNEVVVPVGKKVRLLLTAADVIHAWWVPQLGVKQDAIPGLVRDAWFEANRTGVYRGQCAELCGKNHGFMPIVVRVVEEDEYEQWLAEQGAVADAGDAEPLQISDAATIAAAAAAEEDIGEWTMEAAMARGEKAYGTYCAACHQANGEGLLPAFPALKGSAIATEDKAKHIEVVLKGVQGTTMAAFNYLSDADIAAIITYERNAWDNNTGDLITLEEIQSAR